MSIHQIDFYVFLHNFQLHSLPIIKSRKGKERTKKQLSPQLDSLVLLILFFLWYECVNVWLPMKRSWLVFFLRSFLEKDYYYRRGKISKHCSIFRWASKTAIFHIWIFHLLTMPSPSCKQKNSWAQTFEHSVLIWGISRDIHCAVIFEESWCLN